MPKPNRLIHESSPYLQQHASNPVDWYPWGEEAFQAAREQDKPLLISIGYSSCHWCHVMEEESFENEEIAQFMNEHFINIKVDREERPDIDSYYLTAVQMITGQGGWPLNSFALPDGQPFYGGTYFPPSDWVRLLEFISNTYKEDKDKLLVSAASLKEGAERLHNRILESSATDVDKNKLVQAVQAVRQHIDFTYGGIQGAPKFPLPSLLSFLLTYSHLNDDPEGENFVLLTLDKMASGGIYDLLGGGFARYSTDEYWKVPHFEKMLYDNAQLVSLYSEAYKLRENSNYKEVVYETLAFIEESLTSPEGLFYSALDADSQGEEGLYYVWEKEEIQSLLGDDYPLAEQYFGFGGQGSWEKGRNILLRLYDNQRMTEQEKQEVRRIRRILKVYRDKRVPPGLDDKSLISWNALMITAYADAYKAFGDPAFRQKAQKAAEMILDKAVAPEGRLYHVYKDGTPYIEGFLEDYAYFIQSLITLFEVTGDTVYLTRAEEFMNYVLENFLSREAFLFYDTEDTDSRLQKSMELMDTVLPSPNAVMAQNLFRFAKLTGHSSLSRTARDIVDHMAGRALENPLYFSVWMELILFEQAPYYEIVITGERAEEMAAEMQKRFIPHAVYAYSTRPDEENLLFKGRFVPEKTLFYVCRDNSCLLPVETPEEALALISRES